MAERSEFALIRHYLSHLGANRGDVMLGVGDDAAVVAAEGQSLLMALDTLVDGVHFPSDLSAYWVGHRALAVNLSDIAAMGGEPCWALLSLTLPDVDEAWVSAFADGLGALAERHGVAVVGGDVTRGPLSISVQITGRAPATPLRRDGARVGDRVWVSGHPGDAMGGLSVWQSAVHRHQARWQGLRRAFLAPQPRVALGQALTGIATAAIDISDGLAADAGHIADHSGVAIDLSTLACRPSSRLRQWLGEAPAVDAQLGGGDDYELCFMAPASADDAVLSAARRSRTPVRCIGDVGTGAGITCDGHPMADAATGYRHFER